MTRPASPEGGASPGSPRAALDRANYFLGRAASHRGDEREAFSADLDAAVVFARSAYHFLDSRAKAVGADPAYKTWFAAKRKAMASDRVLEYFRVHRDLTLKERHPGFNKRVFAGLATAAVITPRVEARVTRAQPWYRRSPRILRQDVWRAAMRPVRRWRERASLTARQLRASFHARIERFRSWWRRQRYVPSVREFYLDDPEGLDRNALDLVAAYLGRLDAIVTEAETLYPASVG